MKTFEELGVSPEIRRAIEEMGYENPMPVQEEVIPYLLGENNDVVALAQTGTGKTAAFGLPLLQQIDVKNRVPQSLILCPTRELCLQIAGDLNDYSKYIDGLKVLPVYGGSSIDSQIRSLKRGVHIIVATPGRLLDLMERKTVSLSTIHNIVMDEADEMLNMGFTDSINAILADVPKERNTLLFSDKGLTGDGDDLSVGNCNHLSAALLPLQSIVVDFAVDHRQAAQGQAVEWVTVKDGDVGVLALFQRTDAVLQLQNPGRIDGDSFHGILKGKPVAD